MNLSDYKELKFIFDMLNDTGADSSLKDIRTLLDYFPTDIIIKHGNLELIKFYINKEDEVDISRHQEVLNDLLYLCASNKTLPPTKDQILIFKYCIDNGGNLYIRYIYKLNI